MVQQTVRRSREPSSVYGCRVYGSWSVECRCLWRRLGNQRERSASVFPVGEAEHRLLEDVPGGQEDVLSVFDPGVRSLRVSLSGRGPVRFPGGSTTLSCIMVVKIKMRDTPSALQVFSNVDINLAR